jgi:CO dehydrogenase/acetyl-CoA synthase alpha subunit
MECHFKCPMSMPSSVGELKGLTDHVLCHTTCGQDKACHQTCPNSNWAEKTAQCAQYHEMGACHKACAGVHSCHAKCPRLSANILNEEKKEPSNLLKDVANVLVV